MQIEVINGSGDDEIRDYVAACPNSLIYSCPSFIDLVSDHLNASPGWILAKNETAILGAIPFVQSKSGDLGTVFNSLPYYGSNGGVFQRVPDDQAKRLLVKAYFDYAKSQNACSATLITNPLIQDNELYESVIEGFIRDERIGQITHLRKSDDELIKSFDDPRPRNIRRALKEGIQVSSGNEKVPVEFLYKVHVENIQAIGGLSKSWIFEKLLTDMPLICGPFTLAQKMVCGFGIVAFYFNGTVEYFTPVIKSEHRNTQFWHLSFSGNERCSKNRGCKNWNWVDLVSQGVYDFKKRWGTTDYPYYYYTKLFNEEVKSSSKDTLLKDYPGFFVLPFSELEKIENE